MLNLLRRLLFALKRWLHALLAPAEDPRQTFAYAHERQRLLLGKVQTALSEVGASKAHLTTKMMDVKGKLPFMEQQARENLIEGREDLARLVLRRYQIATAELHTLEDQLREVQQEEQRLKLTEERLSAQIAAFFTRQEIIAARYSAAEAQVRINEALGGVSQELSELGSAIQQAEEKAEHMRARAVAIDHLVDVGVIDMPALGDSSVNSELKQFEISEAVDKQLEALRAEIGTVPPSSAT